MIELTLSILTKPKDKPALRSQVHPPHTDKLLTFESDKEDKKSNFTKTETIDEYISET